MPGSTPGPDLIRESPVRITGLNRGPLDADEAAASGHGEPGPAVCMYHSNAGLSVCAAQLVIQTQ
jgi:hypothetical protein